jgi:hypothetical protein
MTEIAAEFSQFDFLLCGFIKADIRLSVLSYFFFGFSSSFISNLRFSPKPVPEWITLFLIESEKFTNEKWTFRSLTTRLPFAVYVSVLTAAPSLFCFLKDTSSGPHLVWLGTCSTPYKTSSFFSCVRLSPPCCFSLAFCGRSSLPNTVSIRCRAIAQSDQWRCFIQRQPSRRTANDSLVGGTETLTSVPISFFRTSHPRC